jgi:hypothetical protein
MSPFSLRSLCLALGGAALLATAGCSVDTQQIFSNNDGGTKSTGGGGTGGSGGAQGGAGGAQGGAGGAQGGAGGAQGGAGGAQGGSGGAQGGQGGVGGSTTTTPTMTTTTTTSSTTTTTTTTNPTGKVACGNQQCDIPKDICCWDRWGIGGNDPQSGQCKNAPVNQQDCDTQIEQGGVQTVISCQTKDECPGAQFCCGDVVTFNTQMGQISYYPAVECRAKCDWPSRTMCKGPGDPICTGGTTCKQSQLLPQGFFVCSMN